jgi:L-asparaginase/Glu-tRNA(Gln) amidotransferase subunit D
MTNPPVAILLLTTCVTAAQNLPTVVVLSTGGTIASKQDPAKGGYVLASPGKTSSQLCRR